MGTTFEWTEVVDQSTAAETDLEGIESEENWVPKGHEPFAGKYAIERVLGQGGMGTVVAARHLRVGQRVAIKVLSSALREYPELVARFEREARAAGSLSSPHAVRVFDIDTTEDGTPFIVMELLDGRDLADIIDKEGPMAVARAVGLVREACEAIAEAHSLGIIHRDIKPSNLFLANVDGKQMVKVLDFGIAKHAKSKEASITTAVAPLGTPQYMSPEQVRCAKDVDVRTDVWSLGVTLYELLVGRTPFAHDSASACIASIAADPVPDPRTFRKELPAELAEILMRALEKNPSHRFPSVESFVDALSTFTEQPAELVVETPKPRLQLVSRPDRTVPPAVTRTGNGELSIAPRRRSPRLVAMASAAAMAALIVLPRCAGLIAGSDAAVKNPPVAAAVAPIVSPAAAAIEVPTAPAVTVAAAQDAPPAAEELPPAPIATPVAKPALAIHAVSPPPPAPPSLTAHLVNPAPSSSAVEAKRIRGRNERPRNEVAARNAVHGGLSSPGF